jgi:acid phosphatase type 7
VSQRKHVLYVVGFLCCLLISQLILPAPALHAQEGLPLNAVSDIASCISDGDEAVAALLGTLDGLVISPGDNSQDIGSAEYYAKCYEPNFGQYKDRIYPVPGNHDVYHGTLDGYYTYFGDHAGPAGLGYYSFNYGSWHIVGLNSMISLQPTTPQYEWLHADLAANPVLCTLVFVHNPAFHSGAGGRSQRLKYAFPLMYEMGVDVIVSGDAHHYERFSPMNPEGKLDAERGVRQFVVGTGGASHTALAGRWRTTEVRENTTFGITRFFLRDGGYSWRFVPIAGGTFTDTGDWTCH